MTSWSRSGSCWRLLAQNHPFSYQKASWSLSGPCWRLLAQNERFSYQEACRRLPEVQKNLENANLVSQLFVQFMLFVFQ